MACMPCIKSVLWANSILAEGAFMTLHGTECNSIVFITDIEHADGRLKEEGRWSGDRDKRNTLPEERTIAIVFLPLRPKAPGDTFAYFFNDTCTKWSSQYVLCVSALVESLLPLILTRLG